MEENFWGILSGYLRARVKVFALLLLFAFIFSMVFSLYSLTVESVYYASLLCAVSGFVIVIIDFSRYYRRHKLLCALKKRIILDTDCLPIPRDLLERDYQDLLRVIHEDKVRLISAADRTRTEMTDFYTMWAHQIKTPISAMRLLLQTEGAGCEGELAEELFKIEQYVEVVLGYIRFDTGSSDLILRHFKLDDIVRQVLRKFAKQFIRRKISVVYEGIDCRVLTDEKWLVFVLEQIISNALKYTKKGQISIYMENTDKKVLVIEDTGIGIREEDLPRVFEKGFTGYNGHTDKRSTGIGLYLCKRILDRLSHTISIESRVGIGTKVKIGLDTVEMRAE